jgi:hypothetical protein
MIGLLRFVLAILFSTVKKSWLEAENAEQRRFLT